MSVETPQPNAEPQTASEHSTSDELGIAWRHAQDQDTVVHKSSHQGLDVYMFPSQNMGTCVALRAPRYNPETAAPDPNTIDTVLYTQAEWDAFVLGVKAGEFDDLVE